MSDTTSAQDKTEASNKTVENHTEGKINIGSNSEPLNDTTVATSEDHLNNQKGNLDCDKGITDSLESDTNTETLSSENTGNSADHKPNSSHSEPLNDTTVATSEDNLKYQKGNLDCDKGITDLLESDTNTETVSSGNTGSSVDHKPNSSNSEPLNDTNVANPEDNLKYQKVNLDCDKGLTNSHAYEAITEKVSSENTGSSVDHKPNSSNSEPLRGKDNSHAPVTDTASSDYKNNSKTEESPEGNIATIGDTGEDEIGDISDEEKDLGNKIYDNPNKIDCNDIPDCLNRNKKSHVNQFLHKEISVITKDLLIVIIMTSGITATVTTAVILITGLLLNQNGNLHTEVSKLKDFNKDLVNQLNYIQRTSWLKTNSSRDVCFLREIQIPSVSEVNPADLEQIKQSLNDVSSMVINKTENNTKQLETTEAKLKAQLARIVEETWQNITRERTEIKEETERVYLSKETWLAILITGGIVEMFLTLAVVYICCNSNSRNSRHEDEYVCENGYQEQINESGLRPKADQDRISGYQGMTSILTQIKPKPTQDGICIVSFYHETSNKHKQLTKSAMNLSETLHGVTIIPVIINNHEQLLDLPSVKLYLMFVDYNQRNVILEDPKKVLGSLRLTTVQAMRKMKGEILLVYMGDTGSGQLTDGELYNRKITSAENHPVLKDINKHKHFLSIHQEFTQYQKDHIVQEVQAVLN